MRRAVLLAALLAACGGGGGPSRVNLADAYDAVGVGRVLPDGQAATSLALVYLTFSGLQVSGGKATGTVARKGATSGVTFTGRYDVDGKKLEIEPLSGALTASAAESVDQIGALASDSAPTDGVADELSGYLRTSRGPRIFDGSFLGISRIPNRPAHPDETRLAAKLTSPTTARVSGAAGALGPRSGVEVFAYGLNAAAPRFTLGQAAEDGSFAFPVEAAAGDVLLIRATTIGMPGEPRSVTVAP